MTKKRFTIKESVFAEEKEVILDNENQYTFPPLCIGDNYMFRKALNELNDENEQLKQRNSNQYNQLNELWQLIEEENWEKLIAMKKQLKEDEERLQKEWGTYND